MSARTWWWGVPNRRAGVQALGIVAAACTGLLLSGGPVAGRQAPDWERLVLDEGSYGLRTCEGPSDPLFDAPTEAVLEIALAADQVALASPERAEARSRGTVTVGDQAPIPVTVQAQGDSRFRYCSYRPLTIVVDATANGPLGPPGRELYLTTHCGEKVGDQWILGGTAEEQSQWLLAEFYVYSLLELLQTLTPSARLLRVSYQSSSGREVANEFAILVESFAETASRCGLTIPATPSLPTTHNAVNSAELLVLFVANYDFTYSFDHQAGQWVGHNVTFLSDGERTHLLPFDFDLTAIARPGYFKNQRSDFSDHAATFDQTLDLLFAEESRISAVERIATAVPRMRETITNSRLSPDLRARFQTWMDLYADVVSQHLDGVQGPQRGGNNEH